MLTLESWSFPVLGEVSFSTRTLPNRYNVYVRFREGQGLKVLTKNIENNGYSSYLGDDTANTFNCRGTLACRCFYHYWLNDDQLPSISSALDRL